MAKIRIRTLLRPRDKDRDDCVFLGPWLGEFGWELIYWQGFVRRYVEEHPEQYIICGSWFGNSALYESVDEYWSMSYEGEGESDMFLAPIGRQGTYRVVRDLMTRGLLPDRLLLPDRVHDRGWIEFGRPKLNQSFRKLMPTDDAVELLKEKLPNPRCATLFLRSRKTEVEKNWPLEKWQGLAEAISSSGICPVFSGSINGKMRVPGFPDLRDLVPRGEGWTDHNLALIHRSCFIVSGESGPGFLPGLTGTPGIVFGHSREANRYVRTENIFSTPLRYIQKRDPRLEEIVDAALELI